MVSYNEIILFHAENMACMVKNAAVCKHGPMSTDVSGSIPHWGGGEEGTRGAKFTLVRLQGSRLLGDYSAAQVRTAKDILHLS